MPTDTERRLEHLENLLLFGGGVAAGTVSGRQLAAAAARKAPSLVRRHPAAAVIALGYTAHRLGLGPIETAEYIAEELVKEQVEAQRVVAPLLAPVQIASAIRAPKRKISKANKAVKYGMSLLKAGSKAATGADKGKLPAKAFSLATKAAGLANKKTASKIGRGKSKLKNLARKIKKWW